ncbi:hypothetical protein ACFQ1S_16610 [Kibdelosporangium lantanae]|uniref:Uncharacterized protein n=1 Tax=Kibdelosporangium lantanae TaxID=1497396 RepID=A0ABW3M9L7_9PSEU
MKASNRIAVLLGVGVLTVGIAVGVFLIVRQSTDEPVGVGVAPVLATTETEGLAKATSFTATVIVTVNGGCEGGAFSDVKTGGPVQIINEGDDVLSTGTLTRVAGDTCSFTASVRNIPTGEKSYGAKVGTATRPVTWKNPDEARQGWQLTLGR